MLNKLSLFGLLFLFICHNSFAIDFTLSKAIDQLRSQGMRIIYSDQHLKSENYIFTSIDNKVQLNELKDFLKTIGFELVEIKQYFYIIKQNKKSKGIDSGIIPNPDIEK